jgi:hypothetical protein
MKPFSRKGLHRLECQMCDEFGYFTVARLEAKGLPPCWCGERLQPCELELALILEATESRPMIAYMRECNSVARGQAAHGRAGRALKRTPEEMAAERVESERVSHAVWRQMSALNPVPVEAMPF